MKLVVYHDFEGNSNYQLPYVLGYNGLQHELMDVAIHCKLYCKGAYVAAEMFQLSDRSWQQFFHFISKSDAMLCKLRHDV